MTHLYTATRVAKIVSLDAPRDSLDDYVDVEENSPEEPDGCPWDHDGGIAMYNSVCVGCGYVNEREVTVRV